MRDEPRYRAGELLQSSVTIAAVALALATLAEKQGPEIEGYYLIHLTLLFAGLVAIVGSLYALSDLANELGESPPASFRYLQGGLFITGVAYAWLLVDGVP
jgi:hypothetical protein